MKTIYFRPSAVQLSLIFTVTASSPVEFYLGDIEAASARSERRIPDIHATPSTSLSDQSILYSPNLSSIIRSTTNVLAPYPQNTPINRPIFILSIDGGGSRGRVATTQLRYVGMQLEAKYNLQIPRVFDIVAGTSTGGIIGAGLCMPQSDGMTPKYSIQEIDELYSPENARTIFSASIWHKIRTLGGICGTKYQAHGIDHMLNEKFGSTWLSESITNLLISSLNIDTQEVFTFRRDMARETPTMDYRLADVCRATSAAPTYFPSVLIRDRSMQSHTFIDGGVRKNNPSSLALDWAHEIYPDAPGYIMLSLGTGTKLTDNGGWERLAHAGPIGWAKPLISIMMEGSSSLAHKYVTASLQPRTILGHRVKQYFRTQIHIPRVLSALDTTNSIAMAQLRALADPLSNTQIRTTLDEFIDTVGLFFPRVQGLNQYRDS